MGFYIFENILESVEVLTNEDLINVGFKPYGHFSVMNAAYLDVGCGRHIKVCCVGTPNEVVFLVHQWGDTCEEQDLVCVHNFDYDGYLTMGKVMNILKVFGK